MREISIFADESGDKSDNTRYFLLTLVFHNQSDSIAEQVWTYERSLANADLPNVPFHSEPLLNGHGDYEYLLPEQRKKLLSGFAALVRYLPIEYRTFVYRRREFESPEKLEQRMRRDIANLIRDHIEYFQGFDHVKIYYDKGQSALTKALKEAFSYALAKESMVIRNADYHSYRLSQAADFICGIELAAVKYEHHEETSTDVKFFGGIGSFKRNWLKQVRAKRLA